MTQSNLVFPSTSSNLTNSNDIGSGITYGTLAVEGANYAISGDSASFSSIDASQSSGLSTVSLPILLASPATVTVDSSSATLALGGMISGSNGLFKSGSGTLRLTVDNTYTGKTTVNAGTLLIDQTQGDSPVSVLAGATLGGGGTVTSIAATGGTVSPGDSQAGILTASGGLSLAATGSTNSVLSVVLDGATAGVGPGHYSQLVVGTTGTVDLTAATLNLTLGPDFVPKVGSQFTIINNEGSSAISGTFAGLAAGKTITVDGVTFDISYTGGSNANSVVLDEVNTTTTTLNVSPSSPTYGQSVTLMANVSVAPNIATPTGSVQFFQGSTSLGVATLVNGTATLPTTALPVGPNSITADYEGNVDYAPSTSAASTVTVGQATTSTGVTFSPSSPALGVAVTFLATLTPATTGSAAPTGNIEFFNGANMLASEAIASNQASYSTSALPAGSNSITAKYVGDSNYAASTSPATTVTIAQIATSTTVTYSPILPVFGQPTTLTATIAPASTFSPLPTGTVDFFNGTTLLGTGTVANESATLITTALPVGNASLTAQYLGDANYSGSTTTTPDVGAIVLAATTTTLAPLSNTSPAPFENVTLTANVAIVSPGAGTLTGNVTFLANGTSLGTADVSGGKATISVALPISNNVTITAQYANDPNFQNSTSNAVTAVVGTANQQWLNAVSLQELDRAPTQAELTRWENWVAQGLSRKQVVTRIAHSPDAQKAALQSLYLNTFGTPGTPKAYAKATRAAEATHTSHTAVLYGSREYFNNSGATLPNYQAAIETAAIGFELQQPYIQSQLSEGVLPTKVAEEIIQNKLAWQQLINTNYQNILNTAPTSGELNFLVHKLSQGIYLRQILIPLISSNQFYKNATTSTPTSSS